MQFSVRSVWTILTTMGLLGACSAQAQRPKATARPSAPAKQYCQPEHGFCFSYPAAWSMLGESMGDGVVVAPQQHGDRVLWDEITVATIVQPPQADAAPTTIDKVIETAMSNMHGRGINPQTIQRQERRVAGLPAQMLKLGYRDPESNRDWVEELVFIEGPDQEIYSVALKASPANVTRLEPALNAVMRSWKLQAHTAGSDEPTDASTSLGQTSTPRPGSNTTSPHD